MKEGHTMPKVSQKKQKPDMIVPAIMLTADNTEAMEDYLFWTGLSVEQAVNRAVQDFMEIHGESEMWNVVDDRKKRAAAFKRNGYTPEQIAGANAAIEAQIIENRARQERELAQARKDMAKVKAKRKKAA
jgi:hypothetical protein